MDALLISKREAASVLGISTRTLEHLIGRGDIPARRVGRRVLIARTELEKFARVDHPTRVVETQASA